MRAAEPLLKGQPDHPGRLLGELREHPAVSVVPRAAPGMVPAVRASVLALGRSGP